MAAQIVRVEAAAIAKRATPLARSAAALLALLLVSGCGHSARTEAMRTALDHGRFDDAAKALNKEMGVSRDQDLPKDLDRDVLLVLDRGSVQLGRRQFEHSQRDLQAADKHIELLDFDHNATDTLAAYTFSGSSSRYKAPAYEKLLINTINLINYLETGNLNGAKVEARRLAVMQRYYRERKSEGDSPILGLGGFLAGLAYEKSGELDEALRYYDDALAHTDLPALHRPVAALMQHSSYRTPRLQRIANSVQGTPIPRARSAESTHDEVDEPGEVERARDLETVPSPKRGAELIVVVGFGRVPHKEPVRMPIGLVLTQFASFISPADRAQANRLAAQGLVTWVNFPRLAKSSPFNYAAKVHVDEAAVALDTAVSIEQEVRREWERTEGAIVGSAITRMITRFAAGEVTRAVVGDKNGLGSLLSFVLQAGLTATDVPDTRSWEALPARVAVGRVQVAPGEHTVVLNVHGITRTAKVKVNPGGWAFVSLWALR